MGEGTRAVFEQLAGVAPPRLPDAPVYDEIEALRAHLQEEECPHEQPGDSDS